jgi:copper chaperone CopZ
MERRIDMGKETFTIPNISCGHCVMTIKNELGEIDGIQRVEGDADGKTVTVTWEPPATGEKIRTTLADINYPAQ